MDKSASQFLTWLYLHTALSMRFYIGGERVHFDGSKKNRQYGFVCFFEPSFLLRKKSIATLDKQCRSEGRQDMPVVVEEQIITATAEQPDPFKRQSLPDSGSLLE